jgi:ADP-heptose:LPS heptosyltransferase
MPTFAGLRLRLWARWGAKPDRIHYTNGGIGDELMMTAVARAARAAGRPIHVLVQHPGLWQGNPDPLSVQTGVDRWWAARNRGWISTEIRHLTYHNNQPRHIAQQMADHLGLQLPAGWRPVLAPGRRPRQSNRIVLQNSCRGARFRADTKEWPQERWSLLTPRLAAAHQLIQIGTAADPLLPGVEDRRGQTGLREAAHLIGSAALFLGLESGLQHVAAAVSTPSVIIYGGRTRPDQTGYPFNTNLVRSPACSPCGLNEGCPHQMACMDIPVDEVLAAVHDTLSRHAALA